MVVSSFPGNDHVIMRITSKTGLTLLILSLMLTGITAVFSQTGNQAGAVSLQIDGSKRFQQVDGFGVNANTLNTSLENFPLISELELHYTDNIRNVYKDRDVDVRGGAFKTQIPANCIFTLTGFAK